MSLINSALNIGSVSEAIEFASGLTQDVVRIRRNAGGRGLPFTLPNPNPFAVNEEEIFLNVVEVEELEYKVDISEKPVANLGAASDYVSRTSTPLVLTSIICNRSFNLLADPVEALTDIAKSIAPGIAANIEKGVGLASKFIDIGGDEMDAKIKNLRSWQLNADIVDVLGARLDATRHISKNETFSYLIESIALTYSPDFGDGIGLTITLKNLLNIQEVDLTQKVKRGGKLGGGIEAALPDNFVNPFG
jgi:hypothetical protein